MKKLIMACLLAWSAAAMASAGIITKTKETKPAVQKERCCDKGKSDL